MTHLLEFRLVQVQEFSARIIQPQSWQQIHPRHIQTCITFGNRHTSTFLIYIYTHKGKSLCTPYLLIYWFNTHDHAFYSIQPYTYLNHDSAIQIEHSSEKPRPYNYINKHQHPYLHTDYYKRCKHLLPASHTKLTSALFILDTRP
jgi:hypothetical protein